MAHAAVICLKHTIKRLNPTNLEVSDSLNLLETILEILDDPRNRRSSKSVINALDAEIIEAAWKLEDVLESFALHHSLPPFQDLGDFPVDEKGIKQEFDSFFLITSKLKKLKKPSPKEEEGKGGGGGEGKGGGGGGEEEEEEEEEEGKGGGGREVEDEDDAREENDDDDDTDDDGTISINDLGGKEPPKIVLSDQFEIIVNEILDATSGMKPVSIVGMAGIGKTHLAREIYQHQIIVRHFDLLLWVNVGQKDRIEDALVDIVAQLNRRPRNLYMEKDISELMELLQNGLNCRSYLIVLDDIWSTRVFNFLMKWLRPYGKQRRLLLTTRLEDVDECHNTKTHRIRFMDNEESWNLLRQSVFAADEYCPSQLEELGRKIAENCEGLPLLILAIASILLGYEKTEEYWKKVVDKKTTTFNDAYEKISKALFSSYKHLPGHLKPCFLYMGVFPQTCKIPLPKLSKLWIVEDILEPSEDRDLEDLSMEYMRKLVSNSLVIVCRQSCSSDCRIKSSKLHSAYWYLCVKEARKNKFFHVLNKLTDASEECIERQRRLSVQNNLLFGIEGVRDSMVVASSTTRSLLCTGEDQQYPVPICYNLMLLRVLDALAIRLYEFPGEVVKLLLLRYLTLTHNGELPHSISRLQKLQCLVVRHHHNIKILRDSRYSTCLLPEEIWDMQELKHVRIMGRNLPNPSFCKKLPKLSTLYVNAHSCSWRVFRSIPNLAKLGIEIELQPDAAETLNCFKHINLLRRLQSLKCFIVNPRLRSRVRAPPQHLSNLPRCLKKLSLNGLGYSWKCMGPIGSLPNLEVLKLQCSAFQGPEWEAEAGEFRSLEFLLLEDIDLVEWTIYNDEWLMCSDNFIPRFGLMIKRLVYNERCFRRLQRLIFRHCYRLKEIPREIGDIPTLERIEVVDCGPSAVASAKNLKQIKSSLEVVITSSWNRR